VEALNLYLEVLRVVGFIAFMAVMFLGACSVIAGRQTVGHVLPGFLLGAHGMVYTICFWAIGTKDPIIFNAWSSTLRLHALVVILLPVVVRMVFRKGASWTRAE
jgi:hypothetical protein